MVLATVLSMAASALLGLAMAYIAGVRWVAQPLTALIAHTQQIGRGDFTARTDLNSGDELDELAQALNSMSLQLAEQQATIRREPRNGSMRWSNCGHAERAGYTRADGSGLAHELGTPLNVVAGRAALIAADRLDAQRSYRERADN